MAFGANLSPLWVATRKQYATLNVWKIAIGMQICNNNNGKRKTLEKKSTTITTTATPRLLCANLMQHTHTLIHTAACVSSNFYRQLFISLFLLWFVRSLRFCLAHIFSKFFVHSYFLFCFGRLLLLLLLWQIGSFE